jgi:hypothetical protein
MSFCNHRPKFVKVGSRKVFLCGLNDVEYYRSYVNRSIATLDIFIALDDQWDKYEPKHFSNPIVEQLYRKFYSCGFPNLAIIEIYDGDVNEDLAKEIIRLFKEGKKIGFGCVGGHGRTGWLLGKLIKSVEGLKGDDLVEAVRHRWCKEAIESEDQFKSLGVNYRHYIADEPYGKFSWNELKNEIPLLPEKEVEKDG